jgi:hypothetical protein
MEIDIAISGEIAESAVIATTNDSYHVGDLSFFDRESKNAI